MAYFDFVFIIALKEEYHVFKEEFGPLEKVKLKGLNFFKGKFSDFEFGILLLHDMGPVSAGIRTERLLNQIDTALIIQVGIAGVISDDLDPGDVVIGSTIDLYHEGGKIFDDDESMLSLQFGDYFWETTISINEYFDQLEVNNEDLYAQWRDECVTPIEFNELNEPTISVGTIASGSFVISSDYMKENLKLRNRNILAVEMEAGGVINAIKSKQESVNLIFIRGISDLADSSKSDMDTKTKGLFRTFAMFNCLKLISMVFSDPRFLEITKLSTISQYYDESIPETVVSQTISTNKFQIAEFLEKTDLIYDYDSNEKELLSLTTKPEGPYKKDRQQKSTLLILLFNHYIKNTSTSQSKLKSVMRSSSISDTNLHNIFERNFNFLVRREDEYLRLTTRGMEHALEILENLLNGKVPVSISYHPLVDEIAVKYDINKSNLNSLFDFDNQYEFPSLMRPVNEGNKSANQRVGILLLFVVPIHFDISKIEKETIYSLLTESQINSDNIHNAFNGEFKNYIKSDGQYYRITTLGKHQMREQLLNYIA